MHLSVFLIFNAIRFLIQLYLFYCCTLFHRLLPHRDFAQRAHNRCHYSSRKNLFFIPVQSIPEVANANYSDQVITASDCTLLKYNVFAYLNQRFRISFSCPESSELPLCLVVLTVHDGNIALSHF